MASENSEVFYWMVAHNDGCPMFYQGERMPFGCCFLHREGAEAAMEALLTDAEKESGRFVVRRVACRFAEDA